MVTKRKTEFVLATILLALCEVSAIVCLYLWITEGTHAGNFALFLVAALFFFWVAGRRRW